jgi:hypothetical protein
MGFAAMIRLTLLQHCLLAFVLMLTPGMVRSDAAGVRAEVVAEGSDAGECCGTCCALCALGDGPCPCAESGSRRSPATPDAPLPTRSGDLSSLVAVPMPAPPRIERGGDDAGSPPGVSRGSWAAASRSAPGRCALLCVWRT